MHKALSQAEKWGLVVKNVADVVDAPRPEKKTRVALTAAQAKRLLEVARDDRLYALYVLAITTGMRQGELLCIMWEDLDLDQRTLHVSRAVQSLQHKGLMITEPKTAKSRRTIKLTVYAVETLRARGSKEKGLVFATSHGTPFSARNLGHYFHALCEQAGIPKIPFHSLRHTFASLLLSQNVHPKVVQEMLGHSTISMTLDTYSHMIPDMQDQAAGKMKELMQK